MVSRHISSSWPHQQPETGRKVYKFHYAAERCLADTQDQTSKKYTATASPDPHPAWIEGPHIPRDARSLIRSLIRLSAVELIHEFLSFEWRSTFLFHFSVCQSINLILYSVQMSRVSCCDVGYCPSEPKVDLKAVADARGTG